MRKKEVESAKIKMLLESIKEHRENLNLTDGAVMELADIICVQDGAIMELAEMISAIAEGVE